MGKLVRKISIILFLAAGFLFAWLAYQEHQPFHDARIKQEALKEAVAPDPASEGPLDRLIDFAGLKEINPDIIGWLYIPQIGVDQPVLQGQDDYGYLNMDFEGNYDPLGSVFTWAHADQKLSDPHICLFGHNMWSGQMFGKLDFFQDADFMKENGTLYLYTPERSKELQVESVFECYKTDAVFQDDWDMGTGCQTVTLATCSGYDITPYRITVNCKVVREKLIL